MRIVYGFPPNYDQIVRTFNIKDHENVIFTYGDELFVPAGNRIQIDKPLMRHEQTHARQQRAMGIEEWWSQFLIDPQFRLSQELEAYREQYRAMSGLTPQQREGYLTHISNDLGGEIYGNIMTPEQARAVITEGIFIRYKQPASGDKLARRTKKRERQNRKKGRR